MRTGRYRFATQLTQRRWFVPPERVQVLLVEVEEPIDVHGNRSTFWRPATPSDVRDYEQRTIDFQVHAANAEAHVARLIARLEGIAETARLP